MPGNLSTWNESVSAQARRRNLPIEHFIGESLVCIACQRPFRSFRSSAVLCSACRSIGEALINVGQS